MTSEAPEHPDDLVTLVVKNTEFEAQALVAALADEGIEARAFGVGILAGMGMRVGGCPVQVRQADLERARAALSGVIADSVDIDWDDIDVGRREDNLPLTQERRMPLPVMLGFLVAMLALAAMLAVMLLVMAMNPF